MSARRPTIAVVGNSHLAGLKLGWDATQEDARAAELVFFGSTRQSVRQLERRGKSLVPTSADVAESFHATSGGARAIDTDRFDAFFLTAMEYGPQHLLNLAAEFRFMDARFPATRQMVSRGCFMQAAGDALRASTCAATARKLRAITDKPILILAQAAYSIDALNKPSLAGFKGTDKAFWELVQSLWVEAANAVAAELGVKVCLQPESTREGPFFTIARYAHGSVRLRGGTLNVKHEANDTSHMNAQYGALALKRAIEVALPATAEAA